MHDKSEEITEFFTDDDFPPEDEEAELRLVLLIENTSCDEDIIPEHGLSIYIEFNGQKGVYDTGQSSQFLDNADAMHIDLQKIDWVALSHGHYDHTGGLKSLLEITDKKIPVYAGEGAFNPKYARRDNDVIESIGITFSHDEISELAAEVHEINSNIAEICDNIYMVGPAPLQEEYEGPSRYMLVKDTADQYINDMLTDERTLVIRTSQGLVIITGCAHRGSVNITRDVLAKFPDENILMILGGFHLGKTDELSIQKRIDAFRDMQIGGIGLCHCTGAKACRMFKSELGDKCFIAPAGSEILL